MLLNQLVQLLNHLKGLNILDGFTFAAGPGIDSIYGLPGFFRAFQYRKEGLRGIMIKMFYLQPRPGATPFDQGPHS